MELFKIIKEFPQYQISNLGNIKNKSGKILTIGKRKSNSGYIQIRLSKNGKYYYRYLHRLLAETFIENNNKYRTINHIDGNKLNNKLSNLEWASDAQQQRHAFLISLKHNGKSFTRDELYNIYDLYYKQNIKPKKIADILNRPFGTIRKICYGERCADILREYRDKIK